MSAADLEAGDCDREIVPNLLDSSPKYSERSRVRFGDGARAKRRLLLGVLFELLNFGEDSELIMQTCKLATAKKK